MEIYFIMIMLVVALSIDTLLVSIALGFSNKKGMLKTGLIFAFAQAAMALIGLLIGESLGRLVEEWAQVTGGALLVCVAAWLLIFESKAEEKKVKGDFTGWALALTAVGISLDEFAIGFSIGLIGVPIIPTIVLIGIQAFILAIIGVTFGAKLKSAFGKWSEKLGGIVLGLIGIWTLFEAVF